MIDPRVPSLTAKARLRRWISRAVVSLGLALSSRAVHAAGTAHVRLEYKGSSGVAGCLDEPGLRRAIAEHAGYDPILPTAPDAIVVTLTRDGERIVARVDLLDSNGAVLGVRTLDARDGECGELLQAVALSVGIALDRIERRPPPAPEPPPPAPAAPPPEAPAPSAPWRFPRPAIEVAAALSAWVPGPAPAVSLAPSALVAARWGRFDVGLEGRIQLPASANEGTPSRNIQTSLAGGGPQACFHLAPFFGCAVTFVGAFRAEAPAVPRTASKTGAEVFVGARVGGALPIGGGFALRISLDLLANLDPLTVRIAGKDVWPSSWVASGGQIGIAWTIP